MDPYQVVFHPVWADDRVQYPSHFKRFEVQMFAFAVDQDDLSEQVISLTGKLDCYHFRNYLERGVFWSSFRTKDEVIDKQAEYITMHFSL